ncbi:MAG: type 4a pilus biogenesis protein PilO [Oceanococcus sp.]
MKAQQILDELQSLDPNNIGAWPTFAYAGACILLFLVITIGSYYYVVTPNLETLALEQRKEPTLKKEFEEKQAKAANLDAYREQLAEMERSFGSMLRQLPSKSEVANLLNDISQTRVAAGLEETLFRPSPEQPRDFYATLPNKIVVTGSYHEMADFVSRVSALPRIVTVNNVQITGEAGKSDLRMEATINTYRYLSDEDAAE